MTFYQKRWNVIKTDALGAMHHFHQHCYMVRSNNTSFTAPVPKKKGAFDLREHRPISLMGSVYKIFAEVLEGRLETATGKLILVQQNAFIKSRHNADAVQ